MADDDDARGTVGPDEIFSPSGPRRSNFTPPTNDAESLEAAANLFNDDAIAAALAAELAKVASGPIPIVRPADLEPQPPQPTVPSVEQAPLVEQAPASPFFEQAPPSFPAAAPSATVPSAPTPEPWRLDTSTEAESAPYVGAPAPTVPPADAPPPPGYASTPSYMPTTPSAPTEAAPAQSVPPQSPFDSLFDPPARADSEPAPAPVVSPFDSLFDPPAAPAPVIPPPAYTEPVGNGPLDDGTGSVWPVDVAPLPQPRTPADPTPFASTPAEPAFAEAATPEAAFSDPAPFEPAPFDPAPFESTPFDPAPINASAPIPPAAPSPDQPPHRRSLADDELLQSLRDGGGIGDGTLGVIEQLQVQLELRAREAREYAVWEQSMVALGTPDAAAALEQTRAEFAGVIGSAPVPSAVAEREPAAFAEAAPFAAATVPDAPEALAFEPTTFAQPASPVTPEPFVPAEPEAFAEPSSFPEPSLEGTAFADLLARASEGDSTPPPADLVATPFPGFAALPEPAVSTEPELLPESELLTELAQLPEAGQLTDLEQPFASVPTVDALSIAEVPAQFEPASFEPASFEPASFEPAPVTPPEPTFAAFVPPTDESFTGYAAPVDPQHLTFTPPAGEAPFDLAPPVEPAPQFEVAPPVDPALPVPTAWDSPVFLEPPSLIEPLPVVERAPFIEPTPLIEPAPIVDPTPSAWAEVSVEPAQVPAEPQAQEWQVPPVAEPEAQEWQVPSASASASVAEPPAHGIFDNLVTGSAETPRTEASSSTWFTPEPNPMVEPNSPVELSPPVQPDPSPDPTIDPVTGGKRPFGEGVERDNAVDPTDNSFATGPGPVSVNTAGVAVLTGSIPLAPPPVLIQREEPVPPEIEPVPARQRIFAPELAGQEPTPVDERIGRAARMFWLWFAANSSIVAVVFGAIIFSLGMSLREALVATFAGVVISFLPLGLGTLAGKRSGQPTMVVSRATFGVVGNILPATIALLSRLFWAAALLWILGAGGASVLVGARLVGSFTSGQVTVALMAIGFILAVVIAYFGYALIAKVQLVISIVSAILIVGFIALTIKDVNVHTALATGDGSWAVALTGAVLVFSFVGVAWSNSSSDLARYQRVGTSGGASMLWATFGTGVPTFILIAYGALLDASNPRIAAGIALNPLDSLGRLLPVWYPAPLLAATALSLLSGAVLAMYSGGFALQSIGLRLKRSYSTLIVGVLVLVIALILTTSITDYTQLVRDFTTTVAIPVAAWAGMFAAEIMIRNRRFDSVSLLRRGGVYADVRWPNLIALVVITVVGLGFASATIPWLSWEGYLFPTVGVPITSHLAGSDVGVFVALLLGIIFPIVAGVPAIRRQEQTTRPIRHE